MKRSPTLSRLYLEFLAVDLRIRVLKASIYLYLAYTELARLRRSIAYGLIMTYVRLRHPELYAQLRDRSNPE